MKLWQEKLQNKLIQSDIVGNTPPITQPTAVWAYVQGLKEQLKEHAATGLWIYLFQLCYNSIRYLFNPAPIALGTGMCLLILLLLFFLLNLK